MSPDRLERARSFIIPKSLNYRGSESCLLVTNIRAADRRRRKASASEGLPLYSARDPHTHGRDTPPSSPFADTSRLNHLRTSRREIDPIKPGKILPCAFKTVIGSINVKIHSIK